MKKSKKKRNKIDPIIKLAEDNKLKSLTADNAAKIDHIEKKSKIWREQQDTFIRDMEANKLFREMKKRDF